MRCSVGSSGPWFVAVGVTGPTASSPSAPACSVMPSHNVPIPIFGNRGNVHVRAVGHEEFVADPGDVEISIGVRDGGSHLGGYSVAHIGRLLFHSCCVGCGRC